MLYSLLRYLPGYGFIVLGLLRAMMPVRQCLAVWVEEVYTYSVRMWPWDPSCGYGASPKISTASVTLTVLQALLLLGVGVGWLVWQRGKIRRY